MWGRVSDFCSIHCIWKKIRIKEPSAPSIWKVPELKNHTFWVFKKSDSKNCQFWVFQKLQRTTGFHERTSKDLAVWGGYWVLVIVFWKPWLIYNNQVFDNHDYVYQNQVFDFFWYSWSQFWYLAWYPTGFGAISNTRPTLVITLSSNKGSQTSWPCL